MRGRALILVVLSLLGCNGDPGFVRVVQASPSAVPVDIYIFGPRLLKLVGIGYTTTTPYLELLPGRYEVEVRPLDALITAPGVARTQPFDVAANQRVTTVLAGLADGTSDEDSPRVMVFPDAFGAPAAGNARVVVMNTSPDAPPLSFTVGAAGAANIARFASSDPAGFDVPADRPLPASITSNGTPPVAASFTTTPLAANTSYLLIAVGLMSADPDQPQALRLLEAAPDGTLAVRPQDGAAR